MRSISRPSPTVKTRRKQSAAAGRQQQQQLSRESVYVDKKASGYKGDAEKETRREGRRKVDASYSLSGRGDKGRGEGRRRRRVVKADCQSNLTVH